ncbi:MAG: hypothetical protein Q4C64_01415 [Erysipelotrichia bacterium]|nr:hypothetical protein [Erysipelotrichia bacterium]
MLKILIHKQVGEIFRSYFYDAKKNKARSKISSILLIGSFVLLMVVVLGGIFSVFSLLIAKALIPLEFDWMYFIVVSLIAIALGTFGSVFSTYSGLYLAKDNDLLLSLPISVDTIIISRLVTVYLMGLMYSAVVIIPAIIVYWVLIDNITLPIVVGNLMIVLIISVVVLLLSCLLGYVVAKLSQKLHNKSFITVLLSLLFISGYYYIYFRAKVLIGYFLENVLLYGKKIKTFAYPLYLFGRASLGDWKALLITMIITAALTYMVWKMLSKSFLMIATSSANNAKTQVKSFKEKPKSVFFALVQKEFRRFTCSADYMLNCGLSTLIMLIGGFVLLFKGKDIFANLIYLFDGDSNTICIFLCGAICFLIATNDMAACSTSLEGKTIWQLRSLPINTFSILKAKLAFQLILTVPVVIFVTLCSLWFIQPSQTIALAVLLFNILFTLLFGLFCMYLGLKMANLQWTNEISVVKQSGAVVIALFSCWIYGVLFVGIYLGLGNFSALIYLSIGIILSLLLSIIFYIWLKNKGVKCFEEL